MTAVVASVAATIVGSGLLFGASGGATVGASINEYLWALGKYRSQVDELEIRTVRYMGGVDADPARLARSYQELESKYRLMLSLSQDRSTADPSGHGTEGILRDLMVRVRDGVAGVQAGQADGAGLASHLEELRRAAEDVATTAHFAEMQRLRSSLSSDEERRQRLLKCWLVLWTALVLALLGHLADLRRARKLQREYGEGMQARERELALLREEVFAKTTVLGIVSHELKSPLQTIISSVDLLASRVKSPRELEVIERLNSGASRLQAHMQDLTEYARLEAGRVELRVSEFAPNDLVKRVLGDLKFDAEGKGLRLAQTGAKSDYRVLADAHRIQQILTNLVSNAIKYTSEGTISAASELVLEKNNERAPWQLHLTVADDGPGIAPESLPRLFEPFTQLDNGAARRLDGAGLGLAIVKRLVGLLGGTIAVKSELGHGTCFHVMLPVDLITSTHRAEGDAPTD